MMFISITVLHLRKIGNYMHLPLIVTAFLAIFFGAGDSRYNSASQSTSKGQATRQAMPVPLTPSQREANNTSS